MTTAVGLVANTLFYISLRSIRFNDRVKQIKAKSAIAASIEDANIVIEKAKNRIMSVLKTLELYKVAFIYTFSRLFLVICTIYIPIWLNELMKLKTGQQTVENIAIIPLVFFVSSFITAVLLKLVSTSLNTSVRIFRRLFLLILSASLSLSLNRSFTLSDLSFLYLDVS